MARIERLLQGCFPFVVMYALFMIVSLALQALIPFAQKFPEVVSTFSVFLNGNFHLPMDIITDLWVAISTTYIGVDRALFVIDGFKNGKKIEAFNPEKRAAMIQVIFLNVLIYALAVGLNVLFDADFSLGPLAASFGASILCFVAGNKAIQGAQKLQPHEDLDGDGIKDEDQYNSKELAELRAKYAKLEDVAAHSQCIMHGQLNDVQREALAKIIVALKGGKQVSAITNSDGQIIFREYPQKQ